jgi:aspartyl-tRNA(Asn)/glutamyl-tRNA(Gln) amidotransferase subunit B
MKQQSDPKELEKIINEILTKNKDKVDQYKSGKEKLFGFFPDLY